MSKRLMGIGLVMILNAMLAGCNLQWDQSLETRANEDGVRALPTALSIYRDYNETSQDPITESMRAIFAYGQTRGNHPDVFTVVGDSISVSASFLQAIGERKEVLGEYGELAGVIAYYREGTLNAFMHRSEAAGVGWAAWGVLSADLAGANCSPGESPLLCEYRQSKPSIALIMFGTNDAGYRSPAQYRADMVRIIDLTIQMGIIPVLSTPPPRPDTPTMVAQYRDIILELGAMYQIPVWDYYQLMIALPNAGLTFDNIHPSTPAGGYEATAIFNEATLQYGYVIRNLSALVVLDGIKRSLNLG